MTSPARGEGRRRNHGFTLIELAIVLVVIGFLVGGVLVAQDLIKAAAAKAQVTQIEKFNTAVNTFRGKYGALPGDIQQSLATQFGFAARGQYAGEGDGNGLIEGVWQDAAGANWGVYQTTGETALFWEDLSAAHLIEGSFAYALANYPYYGVRVNGTPNIGMLIPTAKIGQGNYVLVEGLSGINYFAIGGVTELDFGSANSIVYTPSITVAQAYNIDKKVDDGLPQSGRVIAKLQTYSSSWVGAYPGSTAAPSATSCYDNGGTTSNPMAYSVQQNSGAGVNCALSFQFQ